MTRLWSDSLSASYSQSVENIAVDLEKLAERVRRYKTVKKTRDGLDYVDSAQNIIHDVNWAVVNLNLDGLVSRARDIEVALKLEAEDDRNG